MNIGGIMKKSSSSCYFVVCLCIFAALSTLTAISGLVLSSSFSHAETSSVLASVTVPDVCTIAADNSSTVHTDTVGVGEYKANIGETVFNITCNDNNGYSIYAVGYSNNTVGNTNLIGTTGNIPTGTANDGSVSNWAMKLTPGTGTYAPTILSDTNGSFANYHVVPTTTTKVATLTSDINVSNSSQFKTSYAIAVASSQAADTYIGKVKYTVVHPSYSNADGIIPTYTVNLTLGSNVSSIAIDGITYNANSSPSLEYGTHTISATFPSGYELDSWSATGNITIADASANPTTINVTGAGTLTLAGAIPCQSTVSGTMQDFYPCSSIANGTTGMLMDSRDNKTYNVAKINDRWWMTSNLRTMGTISAELSNFSGNDFNIQGGGSLTSGNSYTVARAQLSSNANYGAYYNYCAASAGTICTDSNSIDATSDICPSNWRLPTHTEFSTISASSGSGSSTYVSDFNPVQSGCYYYGSHALPDDGYWWSSTTQSTTDQYNLFYYEGRLRTPGGDCLNRACGISIRCIKSS